MRKFFATVVMCTLALCCASCGKTVSGTPSEVIDQAQGLSVDSSISVEVTGYLQAASDSIQYAAVSDDYGGEGKYVFAKLSSDIPDNLSKDQRVTIRGKMTLISDSDMYIDNASVVASESGDSKEDTEINMHATLSGSPSEVTEKVNDLADCYEGATVTISGYAVEFNTRNNMVVLGDSKTGSSTHVAAYYTARPYIFVGDYVTCYGQVDMSSIGSDLLKVDDAAIYSADA